MFSFKNRYNYKATSKYNIIRNSFHEFPLLICVEYLEYSIDTELGEI